MARTRCFALLVAVTAISTVGVGPARAADPPPDQLVIRPAPPGFVADTSGESTGPLDLDAAVRFLGDDAATRKDLQDDKFAGGHVVRYFKGQDTALVSAVFVFEKEIPGEDFVSDARKSLDDDGKATEFDPGIPDAVGVTSGTGADVTHVVLFAKRHHAFLDLSLGPGLDQGALRELARAHHARLGALEPAVEEDLAYAIGYRAGQLLLLALLVAGVTALIRRRRAKDALPATSWGPAAPAWGPPQPGQSWEPPAPPTS